jgi:hypothetical protein
LIGATFVIPPALELDRFFFTFPPSLDGNSGEGPEEGDPGALSADPKYPSVFKDVTEDDAVVDTIGDPGSGDPFSGLVLVIFHCLPSIGLYVFTFSPMQLRNAPVRPGVPGSGG